MMTSSSTSSTVPSSASSSSRRRTIRAFAAFGRNDVRSIRRDTLLLSVFFGPVIYAVLLWFVPPVTDMLQRNYDFDFVPYYALAVSAASILGPSAILGAICGLLLLEEKDQNTLAALRIAPTPAYTYPLYRILMLIVVSTFSVVATLFINRMTPIDVIVRAIPIGVLIGVLAGVLGLLFAVVANNKVEGLALMRAVGMLLFGLPMIPWFVAPPMQYLFGVLPSYWPAKAFWEAWDGGNVWPYVLIGLAYNGLLVFLLLRKLRSRS